MLDNTQSIICAFGLAAAAPRSPYRHLELCGIALRRFSSCFGFQYLQRSGTVKTVPYRMFWGALLTCKISVGRCARRRVSEACLTGNARQFAKQSRSCSCKTHWVLHCSPSHFRKLKCDLLARNPATAARRLLGRPSSRRGETLPTAHYTLNPICRGRCLPSARRAACTAPCPLTTTHYPLSHDAHAATSPIVRVMCPSGAASATNNTPGRAVPAAMRSARACSTARLTLRRSSRAP